MRFPQVHCLGRGLVPLSTDGDLFLSDVIRRHPHSNTTHTHSYPYHGQTSSDTFTLGTASFVIRVRNFSFIKDRCLETLVRRPTSELSMQVKAIQLSPTRTIPNSRLPLLCYVNAFPESVTPSQIESRFRSNGWIPQVLPVTPNLTF